MVKLPPVYSDIEPLIRTERLPTIWCPGCGLGILLKTFVKAVLKSGIPPEHHVVVSGIGCTGRMAGYIRLDSYHVTHGRAIPFAVGIKLAKPWLNVTVISGDGDIASIGGNHLIHAARRNHDITVIMVNNYVYGMTGGQSSPTTPRGSRTMTAPYGQIDEPFNAPYLAYAAGASFVARWTVFHDIQLLDAILRAFRTKGFAFIEVLSPCVIYSYRNNIDMLELIRILRTRTRVKHNVSLEELAIEPGKEIIIGNFVEGRRRVVYEDKYYEVMREKSGR